MRNVDSDTNADVVFWGGEPEIGRRVPEMKIEIRNR
jgi:hypothetical protein